RFPPLACGEPQAQVGAPAAVQVAAVPGGKLETCAEGQGAEVFTVLVEPDPPVEADIPHAGIRAVDVNAVDAAALILEQEAAFGRLVAAALRKAEGVVVIFDEAVQEAPVLEEPGQLEADLHAVSYPRAAREVEAVRLA